MNTKASSENGRRNQTRGSSGLTIVFFAIFLGGNLLGWSWANPYLSDLSFDSLVTYALLGEVVLLVVSTLLVALVVSLTNTIGQRGIRGDENMGPSRSSEVPEGEDSGISRLIKPLQYRPTAQATMRLVIFGKWFALGIVFNALLSFALYFLTPVAESQIAVLTFSLLVISTVVAVLFASATYVVPDYERWVIFRVGRIRSAKGGGPIQLIPFIDEIRFICDIRLVTPPIKFNRVPVRSSAGEGFITLDVWLKLFLEITNPMRVVGRLQEISEAVVARTEVDVSRASRDFLVDQVVGRDPEFLDKLQKIMDPILAEWGLRATVGITDVILPQTMQDAYQKAEAAEVEAQAMATLAGALKQVMKNWSEAMLAVLPADATSEQKISLFQSMFSVETARALAGTERSGVPTFVEASSLLGRSGGLGRSSSRESS